MSKKANAFPEYDLYQGSNNNWFVKESGKLIAGFFQKENAELFISAKVIADGDSRKKAIPDTKQEMAPLPLFAPSPPGLG